MAGGGPDTPLDALSARAWAGLLRGLAAVLADPTRPAGQAAPELADLLAGPVSTIAAGPGRDRVAELLAADPLLRAALAERLAADGSDATAVAALGTGTADAAPADVAPAEATPAEVASEGARAAADLRDLRAELARLRRQRDGAEARARAAEERAERAEALARSASARAEAAEAALARAADERTRAVERAGRRAAERDRDLAADLAGERTERAEAARALAQERDRAGRLAAEVADLRRELAVAVASVRAAAPTSRSHRPRPVGLPVGVAPDTTEAARHLLGAVDLVVVDGYNLTLRVRPGLDLPAQRRWLLERLRALAARGPRVVVVFDGDRRDASRRRDRGVDVRFTSERRIADDEIEFIAGVAAEDDETILVVTDDAGLRTRVAPHAADVVGVLPFTGAL